MVELLFEGATEEFAGRLVGLEEEEVTGVGDTLELTLTHVIEAPRFAESFGSFLIFITLALQYLIGQCILPAFAYLLIVTFEEKLTIQAIYLDLELAQVLVIDKKFGTEVVEVKDTIRVRLLSCLAVGELVVFEDDVATLPAFEE